MNNMTQKQIGKVPNGTLRHHLVEKKLEWKIQSDSYAHRFLWRQ